MPRRARSTFGGRAKSVPSESAQLREKSPAVGFSIESHAFSGFKPALIKRRTASLRVMPALSAQASKTTSARHPMSYPVCARCPPAKCDIFFHAHASVSSRLFGGSTWRIKHTRAYPSRAISAPEAGATSWVSSWLLIGLALIVGMTLLAM